MAANRLPSRSDISPALSAGSAERNWRGRTWPLARGSRHYLTPGTAGPASSSRQGAASPVGRGRKGKAFTASRPVPHPAHCQGRERAAASRRRTAPEDVNAGVRGRQPATLDPWKSPRPGEISLECVFKSLSDTNPLHMLRGCQSYG